MQDFANKKIVVVGGTSGIGKLVAQLVLQRGGSAFVVGRRDDRVAATVQELGRFGLVAGQTADLTRASELEAVHSRIDAEHADANYLVNALGSSLPRRFSTTQSRTTNGIWASTGRCSSSRRPL